jgi:hypothetical protein
VKNTILELFQMRRVLLCVLSGLVGCFVLSTTALAGGPDPDNYPLRVQVVQYTSHSRHSREDKSFSDATDYVDGQGAANLFENGEPAGFEFSNSCTGDMRASSGYETFPARWKKAGKRLEILVPQKGKPWNLVACELRSEMRPGLAYYLNVDDDSVGEESAAVLKDWMVKHQYDPEKGKDDPVMETH